jgi:pantoate--beta-alanine ligase
VIRLTTREQVRRAVDDARRHADRIGLVPTMGYLHEGHLSLLDVARHTTTFVVVSVFVNPIQFGPGEDFERYPRDLERDAALASSRGADVLFAPATREIYPDGAPRAVVDAPGLDDRLCGAFRPGHFRGVLTIVAKLFHLVRPDVAVFGQKDYQQMVLVRRMVRDLDFPVAIQAAPIVREPDGLAMSSRNAYLDAEERAQARLLHLALNDARLAHDAGVTDARDLIARVRARLAEGPLVREQYIELVDGETLEPVPRAAPGTVLALAAFVGRTRLIDNHIFTGPGGAT